MAVSFNDFFSAADHSFAAFNEDGKEVHLRCAMSRAYYGAYHMATDLLPNLGLRPLTESAVRGGVHTQLADRYRMGSGTLGIVADSLAAAHKIRCLADYETSQRIDKTMAAKQLVKCRGIAHRLDQVTAAIDKAADTAS